MQAQTPQQFLLTTAGVVLGYGGALALAHQVMPKGDADYWGTAGAPFDAPEPNYLFVPWIAEFWSLLTVFPLAGVHLLRLSSAYSYGRPVQALYVLTISMYTSACFAHLTVRTAVNQWTCTQVVSNALAAFALYAWAVGGHLEKNAVRVALALAGWLVALGGLAVLPFYLVPVGGVYTLFVVQTPPVVFAAVAAGYLARKPGLERMQKEGMQLEAVAGVLLTGAMVLSYFEVHYGASHGVLAYGFPWMHVTIHALEQSGIYLYGVGVACLHHSLVEPRQGGLKYCLGWPYLALEAAAPAKAKAAKSPRASPRPARSPKSKARSPRTPRSASRVAARRT